FNWLTGFQRLGVLLRFTPPKTVDTLGILRAESAMPSVINVIHEAVEGYHRFTSPQIPGLCVLVEPDQYDLGVADLPDAIALLMQADFGRRPTVTPLETLSDYSRFIPAAEKHQVLHFSINR